MEVYVLVEKRKSLILKMLSIICMIVGAIMFLLGVIAIIFLIPGVLLGCLGYVLFMRYCEYEYSYFDGEVRFAKIINKSKRKNLPCYTMEEVFTIAPLGDKSLEHYERQEKVVTRNYTSGNKDAKVYVMVTRGSGANEMIMFEPDERYLDEVCIKYRSKVVR